MTATNGGAVDGKGAWHVPVLYFADDRRTQERYGLAHNRTQELGGGYDEATLARVLADLAADQGLAGTGWDADDVDDLLRRVAAEAAGPADPGPQLDRAAELQKKWKTKRGQLWEVGKHRLLCGDATKADDVTRLMNGGGAALMVTDPPYGVDYDPHWRDEIVGDFGQRAARGNGAANDNIADWSAAWDLFAGDVAYVWHAGRLASAVQATLERAKFEIRNQIVWVKQHFAMSRGNYHWKHEPCWYGVRSGQKAHWVGDRTQTTTWEIASLNPAGRKEERVAHGTQKPVECMARPLRNHKGDVYDPFLGSGTTIVAAEQMGRRCYALEIEPPFVAVTLERLSGMGLKPRLVK